MSESSNDKLFFYSKSKKVRPGKGVHEIVHNYKNYSGLDNDFRQTLSNFHVCPFRYEGYTYNSIEHVFQSKKIELADKKEAFKFTLESNDEIGKGDGSVAQKNRKLVKLDKNKLIEWNKIKNDVMEKASYAKYSQCKNCSKVLKLTLKAELWHIVSRKKPERFFHLERIRELL